MKLPFGLKDGRIVTVEEVHSGRACGALCPACLGPLVARKGEILAHHFAHDSHQTGPGGKSPCTRGYATAIRQMAAQLLAGSDKLSLPSLTAHVRREGSLVGRRQLSRELVPTGTTLSITRIQHNPQLDPSIKPAVLCELEGFGELAIELSFDGPLTPEARQTYTVLDLNCIEIDFSDMANPPAGWLPTVEDIKKLLYSDETKRHWIFHRGLIPAKRELDQDLLKQIQQLEREHRETLAKKHRAVFRRRQQPHTPNPQPHTSKIQPHQRSSKSKSNNETLWAFCRACYKPWEVDIRNGRPTSVKCPTCGRDVII